MRVPPGTGSPARMSAGMFGDGCGCAMGMIAWVPASTLVMVVQAWVRSRASRTTASSGTVVSAIWVPVLGVESMVASVLLLRPPARSG